jgi:hypothetical protein
MIQINSRIAFEEVRRWTCVSFSCGQRAENEMLVLVRAAAAAKACQSREPKIHRRSLHVAGRNIYATYNVVDVLRTLH